MEQFVYVGNSWAAQSFDPLAPGESPNLGMISTRVTNLAKEWEIPHQNISRAGTSNLNRIDAFYNQNIRKPVIWIYGEPTLDLTIITKLTNKEFIQRADWKDIWNECNQHCLSAIDSLGVPVLLIGGHSDIVNCKYNNITIGYPSWQKWIASKAGLFVDTNKISINKNSEFSIDLCWGAEVIHRFMHQSPNIKPSSDLIDSCWNMLFFWKKLIEAELFYQVHPNYRCTELFAEYLKPTVEKFLQDTTEQTNYLNKTRI